MYPTDDIQYKVSFLDKKEQDGMMLSRKEYEYRRCIQEFTKYYNSMILVKELDNVKDLKKEFYDYLDRREIEIKQSLGKTRELRKCAAMQHALEVINYLRNGGMRYFMYYVMDNYPHDNYDLSYCISQCIINNCNGSNFAYQNGNLFDLNPYTHKVTFNSAILSLIKNYLSGDRTLYNKVEKYYRLAEKKTDDKKELLAKLPVELRDINIDELNTYIKILEKAKEDNQEIDFNFDRDLLEYFIAFDNISHGVYTPSHTKDIIKYGESRLEELFANRVRVRELENYHVLDFFRDHENLDVCRAKFKKYKYDFDAILKSLLQNDFIANSGFNNSGSGFYNENGFSMASINLACEYLNGRTKNYHALRKFYSTNDVSFTDNIPDEIVGANIDALEKIVYYGKNRINNPSNHDFDELKLDMEMLQAIGNYYNSNKTLNVEEEIHSVAI